MKRGDIVIISAPGDYGKPRPAVVIQSDWLTAADSVLLCLTTSDLSHTPIYRLNVQPTVSNGLRMPSQIMVDKIMAIRRDKCGPTIGRLDEESLASLNRMLALAIGIADA